MAVWGICRFYLLSNVEPHKRYQKITCTHFYAENVRVDPQPGKIVVYFKDGHQKIITGNCVIEMMP